MNPSDPVHHSDPCEKRAVPIVVLAQLPPPEHGQSRMVQRAIEALSEYPEQFEVSHVDARFSETLDDIGEGSILKGLLIIRYLVEGVHARFKTRKPLFYYVPGPVKLSSLIRDWALLGILRPFFGRTVFHWHAIGQGEWAHGSERLRLPGPAWLDRVGRKLSAFVLKKPYASICVSETSSADARAIDSLKTLTLHNGISDPCPDFESRVFPGRERTYSELAASKSPEFRILFLSHGTVEKGLFDAIAAFCELIGTTSPEWRFSITFAGGVKESLQDRFEAEIEELAKLAGGRLAIEVKGYVSGEEKQECYRNHEIFLAPSRWESFGLTVAEAMAHGLQVVAAASDGARGVLPPSHGYLAAVNDPSALAENLRRCCERLAKGEGSDELCALRKRFLERFQIEDFKGNLVTGIRSLDGADARREGSGIRPGSEGPCEIQESGRGQRGKWLSLPDPTTTPVLITAYLADQNPKLGRSLGISRMTRVVLGEMAGRDEVELTGITSMSSIQMPEGTKSVMIPWNTRSRATRVLTDHLHPLMRFRTSPDVWYFPKGFLPRVSALKKPAIVTIHDTIIQYYSDHYPKWRTDVEYHYWASILKNTLRKAEAILTVSKSARSQIHRFMERHRIPEKEIVVTYEPCLYETIPQPEELAKADYVLHLASCEPHKRTGWLIEQWAKAHDEGRRLPQLHVVGKVPYEVVGLAQRCPTLVRLPFLDDDALVSQFKAARALILPSEIEGFGLPALEAYYLGTPVCFVKHTSVEEILKLGTRAGGFDLDEPGSLFAALDEVLALSPEVVRGCGLKLREEYAAERVVDRMVEVFERVAANHSP